MDEQNTMNHLSHQLNELKQREVTLRYDIAVLSTKLDEFEGSAVSQPLDGLQTEALSRQLNELRLRENNLRNQIAMLSTKLDELRGAQSTFQPLPEAPVEAPTPKPVVVQAAAPEPVEVQYSNPIIPEQPTELVNTNIPPQYVAPAENRYQAPQPIQEQPRQSSLEAYIGSNVINKIGMAILIIGIAIGVKYAVENDLIGPVMRVVLGYLAGGILLGLALYLREKFTGYSAVLLGGSMAVMYFTTYLGYSSYNIFPQAVTFGIMFIVTACTIYAALQYDMEVIAIFGMVGAYAVPFLLSDGQGRAAILFSYTAIINIGILIIATKKCWNVLFNTAFVFTWLIYYSWHIILRESGQNTLALIFSSIFFITFLATFILNKVLSKKPFSLTDHVLVVVNSVVYYIAYYSLFHNSFPVVNPYAVATLCLGLFHLGVAYCIYTAKNIDRSMINTLLGLGIILITASVPLQFSATTTTAIWMCETLLLFVVAHRYKLIDFLYYTIVLTIATTISLLVSWISFYSIPETVTISVILNEGFITSMLVASGLALITYLYFCKKYCSTNQNNDNLPQGLIATLFPSLIFVIIYVAFLLEINLYWNNCFEVEEYYSNYNYIYWAKAASFIAFTLLYAIILYGVRKMKSSLQYLPAFTLVVSLLAMLVFLLGGTFVLQKLRDHYIENNTIAVAYYFLRYSQLILAAVLTYCIYLQSLHSSKENSIRQTLGILVQICILVLLSNEFVNWLHLAGIQSPNKLVLTVLWSTYAVGLLAYGIVKQQKHLRYMAMTILGIAILKLFFYDLIHLSTLAKTVIFMSLGVLLLLASYLYNKFAHKIDE